MTDQTQTQVATLQDITFSGPPFPVPYLDERGNIWLIDPNGPAGEAHLIVLALNKEMTKWLEISIQPVNYPNISVALLNRDIDWIAAHIRENRVGWLARDLPSELQEKLQIKEGDVINDSSLPQSPNSQNAWPPYPHPSNRS